MLPFVTICTPTYDRRAHIPGLIRCYMSQTYPRDRMEWIVIDDGTDKIGDLLKDVPGVRYVPLERRTPLGSKRNMAHELSNDGEIFVYFDDDDFYPPERVRHAVDTLLEHPRALCAGSSRMYMYASDKNMYEIGPYGPRHATAGTFAFRRKLLKITRFADDADRAEERHFLKNYTIPFVQLDPLKTIVVMMHESNTVSKRYLMRRRARLRLEDAIRDPLTRSMFSRD